jgi:3-oxoacyl-[acyl-carrier protein] reductase
MSARFAGKRVVVTGAAGVYGRELARAFADEGAVLCLVDIDMAALERAGADLGLPADRVILQGTDLTDEAAIQALAAALGLIWPAPDVVVNNAGIYPFGGLFEIAGADWDRVMALNLRAPFLMMQAFARQMVLANVKGAFVNITSASADFLRTNAVPYCVSKRGLEYLAQGFALELAPYGIRVNCARPGFAEGSAAVAWPPGYIDAITRTIPMRRVSRPGDLAGVVLFLASDDAAYVTGATIAADGGGSIVRRQGAATEGKRPGLPEPPG